MKFFAALISLTLAAVIGLQDAKAQSSGVYAAPGMSVKVQSTTLPVARSKPPTISPVFARYWHQTDSQRIVNKRICTSFINQHTRFPATSLNAAVGGMVTALLTVLPDGKVGNVKITSRKMDSKPAWPTKTTSDGADLDTETIRILSQLRFEPSVAASDTVTFWHRFLIQ